MHEVQPASARPSPILHRDKDWLVVDKPCGLATHAGQPGELGAVEWLDLHLGIQAYVVSRLDRETSGALLLAMNPAASGRAQEIHESGAAVKIYEFYSGVDIRTQGQPDVWTRQDPLDGRTATTQFTRLGVICSTPGPGYSTPLVHYSARISRGRKHQVRRHAALSGIPLLGDPHYGGADFPRLCLHCVEIRWPEIPRPVRSPLPAGMAGLPENSARDGAFDLCRDRRGAWPAAVSDAFRVVNRREIPDLPAVIDVYGSWFDAVWYAEDVPLADAQAALAPFLDRAGKVWGVQGGVIRTHRRNPHGQTLVGESLVVGQRPPQVFAVAEHGLRFQINLLKTQHTGLFLDQRDNRARVGRLAPGRRIANLFAFTCAFSVAAAAERAEVVFSVDTARPCLNTGKANFQLNGLTDTGIGKFVQEDVRKWLRRQEKRRCADGAGCPPFGLVICDPPVFAASRDGGQFSLVKEWPWLAAQVAGLLEVRGDAFFANNHSTGDHAAYRQQLQEHFLEVTDLPAPLDFPVLPGRPPHVRAFHCRGPR